MKENINVLDEINKGACMGIDAISYIIDKVKDKKFKKLLERQSSEYKKISEDINEIYSKYNIDDENKNKVFTMLNDEQIYQNDISFDNKNTNGMVIL